MASDLKEALGDAVDELRRAEHLFAAIEAAAEDRNFERPYVLAQIGGHLTSAAFVHAEAALIDDGVLTPRFDVEQRSLGSPSYQRGICLAIEKLAEWRALDRTTPKVVADELRRCNASLTQELLEGFTDVIAVYLSRIMDEDGLLDESALMKELAGAYGGNDAQLSDPCLRPVSTRRQGGRS